jgi:hypothetical protein
VDILQLRLAPPGEQAYEPDSPELVILVNGRDLIDLVREAELPFALAESSPSIAGGYAGLPARLVLPPARHFFGEPLPLYGDRAKVSLLECDCGVPGCWPLFARIDIDEQTVTWDDFEQPHRSPGRGRPPAVTWRYDGLSFRFDRAAYEEELRSAAADL